VNYWKPQSGKVTDLILMDTLWLVGFTFDPADSILNLTQDQKDQAYDWAIRTHFQAAGNRVFVPKKPAFLK
jgi:hypothetical protein